MPKKRKQRTPSVEEKLALYADPLVAESDRALRNFVEGATIPLYGEQDRIISPYGTGTLFCIEGHHLLITARHVLEAIPEGTLMIGMDRGSKFVTGPGEVTELRSSEQRADLAILELHDAAAVAALAKSWTVLNERHIGAVHDRTGQFFVAGYPRATDSRPARPGRPLVIAASGTDRPVRDDSDPFDPEWDLLLEWDRESFQFPSGLRVPSPKLHGMSGASVWQMQPPRAGEVWTPTSELRVVAVQTSVLHGRYIRAKKWTLLWCGMKRIDEVVARTVRRAIQTHHRTGH